MSADQIMMDIAYRWSVNGDLITCRLCGRAIVASRHDEEFLHKSDCRNADRRKPWQEFRRAINAAIDASTTR